MGAHLTGSVGIVHKSATWRTGKAPGNTSGNQTTVIGLLAKIPTAEGGQREAWSNPPVPGVDGVCTPALADAIWAFQSHWKAKGVFKNIDGVVDPGGNTLRVLNSLVIGGEAKKAGPNALNPANTTNLNKLIGALRAEFPRKSRWTLTNAPGLNVGFTYIVGIGLGAGQLDVKEDGAAEERHLTYGSFSAEMGWSPSGLPLTFSFSTRDMRSATELPGLSGMGRIITRQADLTLDDMTGPMAIFGATGCAPDKLFSGVAEAFGKQMLMGASFNLYMIGISPSGKDTLMRLPQMGHLGAGIMNVVKDCKAIAMSAGECAGFDLSLGVAIGAATARFAKIEPPKWVTDNAKKGQEAAKPYVDAYEGGKKIVEDAIKKKLNEWNPFG